jgi:hypothetical protein
MAYSDIALTMLAFGVIAAAIALLSAGASHLIGTRMKNRRLAVFLLRVRSREAAIVAALLVWAGMFSGLYYCCG